jgi:hypothetical protein
MADQHPTCLGGGSQDLVVPKTGETCFDGGNRLPEEPRPLRPASPTGYRLA